MDGKIAFMATVEVDWSQYYLCEQIADPKHSDNYKNYINRLTKISCNYKTDLQINKPV